MTNFLESIAIGLFISCVVYLSVKLTNHDEGERHVSK